MEVDRAATHEAGQGKQLNDEGEDRVLGLGGKGGTCPPVHRGDLFRNEELLLGDGVEAAHGVEALQ